MKGLKKIALVSAIAAVSSVAQAELKALDDTMMGDLTGQAGISIELNTNVDIGAIVYTDTDSGGKMVMSNISIGGAGNEYGTAGADVNLDDVQIDIDIAADGDAVIDIHHKSGEFPLDFGLDIGSIGLGASTETVGQVNDGTVFLANLELDGFLGPVDIIIDGGDSGMNISGYFNAAGHVDQPFKAVQTDFYIHNSRGVSTVWLDTQDKSNSMAHIQINISKKHDYLSVGQTALAFDLQNFEADLDFENVTLGTFAGADGRGIGDIYFTDLSIRAETVVYGH